MIIIRDPTLTSTINDPAIRNLAETRFTQILAGEIYNNDSHGYFIVVEPGDSIADLEAETCCSISVDPMFEALEEHDVSNCFNTSKKHSPSMGRLGAFCCSVHRQRHLFQD